MIFHDASLERITGQQGIIEEMSAAAIRKIKTKKGNSILFLDELLDFLKDKPGVYLELEMKTNPTAYPQRLLEKYCDQLYEAAMAKKPAGSTYNALGKHQVKTKTGRLCRLNIILYFHELNDYML